MNAPLICEMALYNRPFLIILLAVTLIRQVLCHNSTVDRFFEESPQHELFFSSDSVPVVDVVCSLLFILRYL